MFFSDDANFLINDINRLQARKITQQIKDSGIKALGKGLQEVAAARKLELAASSARPGTP